ncbi:hypothetical protein OUZ56_005565 [Daphnia magna]|uniref:Uncharacterized protein n=1 Tax=Daphnia magna TaxID=35525 RepID=A0ABQ9YTV1_9CRUS|nr:hypothetical protein OUZ56_005565 [Daphnia magna]
MGKHLKNGFVASLNAIVFYLSESQSKQVKLEPHDSIRRLWTLTSTSWRIVQQTVSVDCGTNVTMLAFINAEGGTRTLFK